MKCAVYYVSTMRPGESQYIKTFPTVAKAKAVADQWNAERKDNTGRYEVEKVSRR